MSTVISFKDGQTGVAKDLQRAAALVRTPGGGATGQKAFAQVFPAIDALCEKASLPGTVRDTAKQVYQRVDQEKLLRGKSVDAVVAACVFVACRQQRVPRTLKEMVALSNVPLKVRLSCCSCSSCADPRAPTTTSEQKIAACFKILQQVFEAGSTGGSSVSATGTSTDQLVRRLCSQLGLPIPTAESCSSIALRVAQEGVLTGRTPSTVAGACISFGTTLFGEHVELSKISEVTGVAEGTIKVALAALWPDREKVVKQEWFDPGRKRIASWDNVGKPPPRKGQRSSTPDVKGEVKGE